MTEFWNWYIGLFSDTDNKVRIAAWTVTITTVTFAFTYIITPSSQLILRLLKRQKTKKEIRPAFTLAVDKTGKIFPIKDKDFETKIKLARQLIRDEQENWISIELVPNFKINRFDKVSKEEFNLKLKHRAEEIKKKIEILLIRPIDIGLEYNPDNIKTVINSLLEPDMFYVTGLIKLDIYRADSPIVYFPVYLTQDEFQNVANNLNKTTEELMIQLRIPTMTSISIFDNGLLFKALIPSLVKEIYRIHMRYNFNLATDDWQNISSYEIGLG